MFLLVISTPFGLPVVPDVYIMFTTSSGLVYTTSQSFICASSDILERDTYFAFTFKLISSVRTSFMFALEIMYSFKSLVAFLSSGTYFAPNLKTAIIDATISIPLFCIIPIASPYIYTAII